MTTVRAVLLDVHGTLLRLDRPAERLRAGLLRHSRLEVNAERAAAAFDAEVTHYLRFHVEGRDRASAGRLRVECAEVVARHLGVPPSPAVATALAEAIAFQPFPDAVPALVALRERGLRLVAASNWDCTLHDSLEATGLAEHLDGAVSSAEAGAPKPDPAVFERALELAGCSPSEAIHVGDSWEADVLGASAAGLRAVLLQRSGGSVGRSPKGRATEGSSEATAPEGNAPPSPTNPPPHQTIESLTGLAALI